MRHCIQLFGMFILLIILSACPEDVLDKGGFDFYNYSSSDVDLYLGLAKRENGGTLYPDTMISRDSVAIGPILKNGGYYYYQYNKYKSSDILCLYIFNSDTLRKYSWEEIKEGYKVLRRYDLNVNYLKEIDYKVCYPPSENMENIQMYPPYE